MICPWCREEGKKDEIFFDFAKVEEHLRQHGATDEQVEQAHKAWRNEMIGLRNLQYQEFEATQ